MADTGFFAALKKLVTFYWLRKALGLSKAADEMFTSSAEGIGAAFDIQQNQMVEQYRQLRDAVAQVENVIESKRQELERLNEEEQQQLQMREGALAKAQAASEDSSEYEQHAAAFERFDQRINEIEERQAQLETEIGQASESMKRYLQQLSDMQAEIQRMPQQKAEAIADHVSATKIIELNDRLAGIQTSFDRGPVDAVLKANRELTSRARISERLAGTDVRMQDAEYSRAGAGSSSRDKMRQMLAARRRDTQQAETQETPSANQEEDDRPDI